MSKQGHLPGERDKEGSGKQIGKREDKQRRSNPGKLVPRPRAFALDDLLGALAAEIAALANEKGLSLRYVPR